MARKQLKIALSEDFYLELNKEARKHKIPVSTFARSLIAAGLKEVGGQTQVANKAESTKADDVILLSDVLADGVGTSKPADQASSTKVINPDSKTPVSIQIIFNN